jgi:ABC-type multidrug transport system fused ATPase/permease subunit
MIALLLRMLEPLPLSTSPSSVSPQILIDDKPLTSVNRTTLRTRIIAASQDSVFLPDGSSFRANLDPWSAASATEALAVLETIGLQDVILARGGIDAPVNAAELSAGQKQMFVLGRAILRRRVRARLRAALGLEDGGVLLLDEMTASVDAETEKRMMEVVEKEFENYTVLMVTHSMELARGCGRVVVLDRGKVFEDGEPWRLEAKEGGSFRALVLANGGG